mmetsp:Transcript_40199/g.93036  ORF Transcript_40199/g.93036 Transcript_40199/m.93036 type:complete len:480 (-) Transcript_40199:195-1634(-)
MSILFNARKKWQEAEAKVILKTKARKAPRKEKDTSLADRDHWEAALASNWKNLIDAPDAVKADPSCVEIAAGQSWKALQYASEDIRNDPVIALPVVQSCWWALEFLGQDARRDEEVAIAALRQSAVAFELLSTDLRSDLIILQEAVRVDGTALRFASKELRADRSLVKDAVRNAGGEALQYAAQELRNDAELVLLALQAPTGASKALASSNHLAADSQFLLKILEKDGLCLQYAASNLKADPSTVICALGQNGEALQFASEELRDSRKVVETAVLQNPQALRFASEQLLADEDLVKKTAEVDGTVLRYAVDLCDNKRVATKAVAQTWEALPFEQVDGGLPPDLLLEAVKQDWRAIIEILAKNYASEDLLLQMAAANPEVVRARQLRGHRAVAKIALAANGLMMHYLLPDLRCDLELASLAVRQNPDALSEVHPALRREPSLRVIQAEGLARRGREEIRRRKAEQASINEAQPPPTDSPA